MIGVISKSYNDSFKDNAEFESSVKEATNKILNTWAQFEEYIKIQPANIPYFRRYTDPESGQEILEVNFDNYYKGRTLPSDLLNYFK